MKRLISLFAGAFAALILTCASAQAQYLGCFESNHPYTLEVFTSSKVALTILQVTSKGRLDVEEIRVFDSSSTVVPESRTLPRNVDRLIFMAHTSVNGYTILKLTQGTQMFEVTAMPNAEVVIDLSPGPLCGGR
ncbi:MAG TPA: hypothetical protein VGK99_17375 [Acidobacteriota bacterium]|jgi:hypothetical protein